MQVALPDEWPVASRSGVAVARLMVVDQRGEDRLVCDGLHDGPHFWPDDEPAPPIWDAALDASLAATDQPDSSEDAATEVAPHDEHAANSRPQTDA